MTALIEGIYDDLIFSSVRGCDILQLLYLTILNKISKNVIIVSFMNFLIEIII